MHHPANDRFVPGAASRIFNLKVRYGGNALF